ncbi:hypothetical protein OG586_17640 [Streptomyces murinus]|uniref:hypothetical protein n=1 Tax=Streptomyces murinus TaxID=33900 RepID=UPI002E801153|nr:hypothetical protein [Streptomyces murinus]WUD07927.1 hypothetical protein OG586_17640 [Streptomyces murinus]
MTRYRKTGLALASLAGLLSTLSLSGTAQAADASVTLTHNGHSVAQALSYGANGAVRVCDLYPDGDGVRAYYSRVSGGEQILYDAKGSGTCSETTDIPGNPIRKFKACVVDTVVVCTPYVYTGR